MSTATDHLANKLLEIINQIQAGILAHAADAMKLALMAVQQEGIANIFPGLIALVAIIICTIFGVFFYKKWRKRRAEEREKDYYDREDVDYLIIFFGIPFAVAFFAILVALTNLGDYWNYVQIFNPKVYLAHEIIQKVMQ